MRSQNIKNKLDIEKNVMIYLIVSFKNKNIVKTQICFRNISMFLK